MIRDCQCGGNLVCRYSLLYKAWGILKPAVVFVSVVVGIITVMFAAVLAIVLIAGL